jgi:hypothetical protein
VAHVVSDLVSQDAAKVLMKNRSTLPAHFRIGGMTAAADVLEHWKAERENLTKGLEGLWQCA